MKMDVKFEESDKSFDLEFNENDHSFGLEFGDVQFLKGEDGKSAYELAVEHGFEGSEEEWLESLQATDGKDGYTPIKGVDYFDGEDGEPGASGVYVGTDTPPENADVWVDPSATPSLKSETWTFTLEDETTVEKTVVLVG